METAFIKFEDGVLHLRRSDEKIAEVPLDRLPEQNQAYVTEQAKQSAAP